MPNDNQQTLDMVVTAVIATSGMNYIIANYIPIREQYYCSKQQPSQEVTINAKNTG